MQRYVSTFNWEKRWRHKKQRSYINCTTTKHEVNALKWKNRRNGKRARRLQMGRNFIERNVETWTSWNMGDTSQTFSWDLENSTTNTESELCWTNGGDKESSTLSTSTSVSSLPRSWWTDNTSNWWVCNFTTQNMRITTLRRCTTQSRITWRIVINTFQSLEETSMLSGDLEKERNVKVWAGTLSTRVTKEVIGWKAGWCYRITPLQYKVQDDISETDDLLISKRQRKTNRLHMNKKKTLETHQRYRS